MSTTAKNINSSEMQAKIQAVADKIAREFKPEKIILFGSYAWGNPGTDSDVDLFIVKDTENTWEAAIKISGILYPRPFPVDLLVYTPNQVKQKIQDDRNLFIEDIVNNGKVIYDHNQVRGQLA
ncbi:MAG: nucleotidyltransferase domain-containing protein [Patescibacteria group bacterium]